MRYLKEVLVLAALVVALAFAARQLEGVDAGRIDAAGVPSFTEMFHRLIGSDDDSAPEDSVSAAGGAVLKK